MDDEAALLAAICAHPDEDTPRLAFADWLTEQGGAVNAAWAGGIRAQIAIAAGSLDSALKRRVQVFESWYGLAKLRERLEVPLNVDVGDWERGFPSVVGGPYWLVRGYWSRVANRLPFRELRFDVADDAVIVELVSWAGLERVTSLRLGTNSPPLPQLSEAGVATLAASPALAGLRALTIGFLDVTEAMVLAVLDSPHLAGLRRLTFRLRTDDLPISRATHDRLIDRFGRAALPDLYRDID